MARPRISGYNFKRECVENIRSDRELIDDLGKLLLVANTPETTQLLVKHIQNAIDRIERHQRIKAYECPALNGWDESDE